MDKRYQVFVSSTYVDLEKERQSVLQTLMEMDCIPAGMELFPAADEEQWEFIKRIIDDCDYYILIIGGRYGSIAEDGLSYTEKEFDYAVSKGIKVIALLHNSPDELPGKHLEKDQENIQKLQKFRDKIKNGRLVRHWDNPAQLPGEVSLSLNKTIKMFPAIGWVRANSTASPELLAEIHDLRRDNDSLRIQLDTKPERSFAEVTELANFDSEIMLSGKYHSSLNTFSPPEICSWSQSSTWKEVFSVLSPFLISNPLEALVDRFLAKHFSIADTRNKRVSDQVTNTQLLYTIRIQFIALNLITVNSGPRPKWELTDLGNNKMLESRVVKNS